MAARTGPGPSSAGEGGCQTLLPPGGGGDGLAAPSECWLSPTESAAGEGVAWSQPGEDRPLCDPRQPHAGAPQIPTTSDHLRYFLFHECFLPKSFASI